MLINYLYYQDFIDLLNQFNLRIQLTSDSGRVRYVRKYVFGKGWVKHTYFVLGIDLNTNKEISIHHNKGFDKPRLAYTDDIRMLNGSLCNQYYDEDYLKPYDRFDAINKAFNMVINGKNYSTLDNNCHMFTSYTCYNKPYSKPAENAKTVITLATFVGVLAIANRA